MIEQTKHDAVSLYYNGFWSVVWSRLQINYERFQRSPRWLLMFIIGRFAIVRSIVFFLSQRRLTTKYDSSSSMFEDLKVDDVADTLKQDGVCLGIKLPKDVLQEILSFANSTNCYGDGKYNFGFLVSEKEKAEQKHGETFVRGEYYNTALLCPTIKRLANDPKLLEIAAKYLGREPVYTGSRLHWIFVVNEEVYDLSKGALFFHYDLDDYRCFRFFFYLTDVDISSGPHVCIRGSHKKKRLSHLVSLFKRQPEQAIIDYYGAENILNIGGEAGYGFAEDVFCFHKATPPISQPRLLLQIQFALNDYGNHNDIVKPELLERCL